MTNEAAYLEQDARDLLHNVVIGAHTLTRIVSLTWDYRVASVPTCTIVVAGIAPAAVVFDASVRVDVGFVTLTRVFTGRITAVNHNERETIIECSGYSLWLDTTYHKLIYTFANVTAQNAITDILELAGVPFYSVTVPAWTIGTVSLSDDADEEFVTLEFQTYGDAITKIGEPDGSRWAEMPTGTILVRNFDPIPALTHWRTYFSGQLTGIVETQPAVVAVENPLARPRIRSLSTSQQIRDVKNQAFVRGVTFTQTNADGTVDSIDVEGDASAPSPWVVNFNGTQAYNDILLDHELIDTALKAAQYAAREVSVRNRLNDNMSCLIDGDVDVFVGRTVRIIDPDYSAVQANYFVEGYTTALDIRGRQFTTSLDLIGGSQAGGAINISPFALFSHVGDREVMGDRVWVVLTLDGTPSFDADGEIVSWVWSGNVSGSGEVLHTRVDPAAFPSGEISVTLTVTDDDGAVDAITLTVPINEGDDFINLPAEIVANGDWFSFTPNGGIDWNDQEVPGSDLAISCAAKPPDGATFGTGIWGTQAGAIYRTTDYAETAPTLVLAAVGSPMVHVWPDLNHTGTMLGVTRDGRLYRSDTDGLTWNLHDNLRTVLGKPGFIANRIATPPLDGFWVFGGDGEGRPVMCFDFDRGHHWGQVALGGDLLIDILTNPVATDLYVADAGNSVGNDLAIILNSATFTTAVYYTTNSLGDGSAWKRATGLPGKTRGSWLTPNLGLAGAGEFQFGYNDHVIYLGDVAGGVIAVTTAAAALDASDDANHGLAIGAFIGGIGGSHMVAAEGSNDGTLYKTYDRFGTIDKHRPATGFAAPPAGANTKMVNITAAGGVGPSGSWDILLVAKRAGGLWCWRRNINGVWTGGDIPQALWIAANEYFGEAPRSLRLRALGRNQWFLAAGAASNAHYFSGMKSLNEGGAWALDEQFLIDYAKGANGRLYSLSQSEGTAFSNLPVRIRYSINNGASWAPLSTLANDGVNPIQKYHLLSLKAHPLNQQRLVAGAHAYLNPPDELQLTLGVITDGANISAVTTGIFYPDFGSTNQFSYERLILTDSGRIVLTFPISNVSFGGEIWTSDDFGGSWTVRYSNSTRAPVHLAYMNGNKVICLLAREDASTGFLVSNDQGTTWSLALPSLDDDIGSIAYDSMRDQLFAFRDNDLSAESGMVYVLTPVAVGGVWRDISAGITLGLGGGLSTGVAYPSIAIVPG